MSKVIKIKLSQNVANYGIAEEITMKNTLPLPAVSTVLGAIHKAAGWKEYHKLRISIKGEYDSMIDKMYKATVFLNTVNIDRGTFVKLEAGNALSNAYTIIAKADDNTKEKRDLKEQTGFRIFRKDLLDEYNQIKETINQICEDINKLKKKRKIETKELKGAEKKKVAHEYDEKIQKMRSKKINWQKKESVFRTLEKIPRHIDCLTNVRLTLYIQTESKKDYITILEHINDIKAIGRAEDFVDIISVEELEYKKAQSGWIKEHVYIPLSECKHFIKDSKKLCGTVYHIRESWTINEKGQRIFRKAPCLYCCDIELIEESEKVFVDEKGELFVLIN